MKVGPLMPVKCCESGNSWQG